MKKVLTLISLQYYDDAKAGIATLFITIWAKDKEKGPVKIYAQIYLQAPAE